MPSLQESREFERRFIPHYREILQDGLRVPPECVALASDEDDRRRNTDMTVSRGGRSGGRGGLGVTMTVDLPRQRWRIACRVRTRSYVHRYRREFTIRWTRPSMNPTEIDKLMDGYGDFILYGFESAPGSDRLGPFVLGNLRMLTQYIQQGGYKKIRANGDGSSCLAAFHLDDMPLGFQVHSDGHEPFDVADPWLRCRQCHVKMAGPLDDDLRWGCGYERKCLFCGFRWRAGWIAPLTVRCGSGDAASCACPICTAPSRKAWR